MNQPPPSSESQRGLDTLTELYRDGLERPDRADLDRGLSGVRTLLASRTARRTRVLVFSLAGAAAAVFAILVVRSHLRTTPPASSAITYAIEGGTILKGGYLRESGSAGIALRFSEGSQVSFDPGTRGRLQSDDSAKPRLTVDHGKALFQIRKTEGRRWLVEAGPFVVTVKGTVFSVAWDPVDARFDLRLRQGHVSVSGPTSKTDIDLEAGQRLTVNLAKAETIIGEDKPDVDVPGSSAAASAKAPSEAPVPGARPRPVPRAASLSMPTVEKAPIRWADEFAQGRWDRILQNAEQDGLDAILAKASADDLFILADAARYRHRPDLARAALLAERKRFPSSPRTPSAAFLLGRVEESSEKGRAKAIAWYDEYLSRAPTGSLAAEALGRKMMLTAELHGPERARPLAAEYLRRFPDGSYARSARLLQPQPGTP